jgi:tRNA pseudouridine55 synthase
MSKLFTNTINGILLLNKPLNLTSNAALQRARYFFRAKKAGHTGSLDPLASGMLPICFGEATKFSQYLLDADKYYQVIATLGVTTSTGDAEGEITKTAEVVNFSEEKLLAILPDFTGKLHRSLRCFRLLSIKVNLYIN